MSNNVRRLRVAFLLTPKQLAARMCADGTDVERIEAEDYELSEEWIAAVAAALGVPASAVTDPDIDIEAARATARVTASHAALCPIATRYAILAVVAKLAGLKVANRLDEDDLARAIQNFNAFIEAGAGDVAPEERVTRQSLGLRITVLAILQSRGVAPGPRFEPDLDEALAGATAMLLRFSAIGL